MYPKMFEGQRSETYNFYSISLSLAAFAFVGVEMPAATAWKPEYKTAVPTEEDLLIGLSSSQVSRGL